MIYDRNSQLFSESFDGKLDFKKSTFPKSKIKKESWSKEK
jgi:hypothetical protein